MIIKQVSICYALKIVPDVCICFTEYPRKSKIKLSSYSEKGITLFW